LKHLLFAALAVSLIGSASAQSPSDGTKADENKDKLICKREVPIGSLIATRKMCLTKEQWRKRQDDGNATARGLVEDGAGACGQNGGVCGF
jgi:hypothetical protein